MGSIHRIMLSSLKSPNKRTGLLANKVVLKLKQHARQNEQEQLKTALK
jgi:hypothetical protein